MSGTDLPGTPDGVAGVYLVADAASCRQRGVAETVGAAVGGGVRTVQVRSKDASAAQLLALVTDVAEVCDGRALVVVNDRVDVFLAARERGSAVHGVHVGQDDLPPDVVRRMVGPTAVVGLSAATPDQVAAASALPRGTVDYLGVGVIRPTPTKTDAPTPLGVEGFAEVCRRSALPCVAIGGVRVDDLPGIRTAGGAGAAVVSAVCAADDPGAAAALLVSRWHRG